MIQVITFVSR